MDVKHRVPALTLGWQVTDYAHDVVHQVWQDVKRSSGWSRDKKSGKMAATLSHRLDELSRTYQLSAEGGFLRRDQLVSLSMPACRLGRADKHAVGHSKPRFACFMQIFAVDYGKVCVDVIHPVEQHIQLRERFVKHLQAIKDALLSTHEDRTDPQAAARRRAAAQEARKQKVILYRQEQQVKYVAKVAELVLKLRGESETSANGIALHSVFANVTCLYDATYWWLNCLQMYRKPRYKDLHLTT